MLQLHKFNISYVCSYTHFECVTGPAIKSDKNLYHRQRVISATQSSQILSDCNCDPVFLRHSLLQISIFDQFDPRLWSTLIDGRCVKCIIFAIFVANILTVQLPLCCSYLEWGLCRVEYSALLRRLQVFYNLDVIVTWHQSSWIGTSLCPFTS